MSKRSGLIAHPMHASACMTEYVKVWVTFDLNLITLRSMHVILEGRIAKRITGLVKCEHNSCFIYQLPV